MFTYAILKAVRLGLISKADYQAVGTKAYQGLITNFVTADANGVLSLNLICKSAGLGPSSSPTRDGTINYYLNGSDAGVKVSNDLKGVGPFILASVEYEILQATLTDIANIPQENLFKISRQKDAIIIRSSDEKQAEVDMYNSIGKLVIKHNIKENNELKIPTSNYISGIYILTINHIVKEKILI